MNYKKKLIQIFFVANIIIATLANCTPATITVNSENTIQAQLSIVDKIDFCFEVEELEDILFNHFENLLYYLPANQDITADSNLYIFSYSIQNKKLDTITVKFPAEHLYWRFFRSEKLRRERGRPEERYCLEYEFSIESFAITEQFLVVSGSDRILVFARNENNFEFLYAIKPEEIYGFEDLLFQHFLKIKNDTLLAYRSHTIDAGNWGNWSSFADNAADSQLVSTVLMKYHLRNRELIHFEIIYPEPKGFGFLNFMPRQNIDFNGKYFVISDVSEYNLYLFDTDWNLVDKISPNHLNWVQDENLPDAVTVASAYKRHPTASIRLMQPFTHTTSLTHNIMFKNSETILVSWSIPTGKRFGNRYKFFFDKFKIIDGKLELINTFEQAEFNKKSSKLFGTAGANALEMPTYFYLFDNYLITISEEVPFDIFSDEIQNMSLRDYYKKLNAFYRKNDIIKSILIYKFKEQ